MGAPAAGHTSPLRRRQGALPPAWSEEQGRSRGRRRGTYWAAPPATSISPCALEWCELALSRDGLEMRRAASKGGSLFLPVPMMQIGHLTGSFFVNDPSLPKR